MKSSSICFLLAVALVCLGWSLPSAGAEPESRVGSTTSSPEDTEHQAVFGPGDDKASPPDIDEFEYLPLPIPSVVHGTENVEGTPRPDGDLVGIDLVTRTLLPPVPLPEYYGGDSDVIGGVLGDPFLDSSFLPGADGVMGAANFTSLSLVTSPTTGRYPTHVKLFMKVRDTGGTLRGYVASGTLIDATHVLTAGHCVYFHDDPANGWVFNDWAEEIRVVPAYDNGATPFGDAYAVQLHSWTGWTVDEDFDHDVGVIDLDRPVGALTGWRGYGYNDNCSFFTSTTWYQSGYPASSPYNGQRMYTQSGDFDACEYLIGWYGNEVSFNRLSYGGSSGSGAVKNDAVFAVLSNGNSSTTWDCRVTSSKFSSVQSFISADTPTTVDLIPLNVRTTPGTVNSGDRLGTMDYLVHNYSSASYSGTYTVEVYLSTNEFISTSDVLIQTHTFTWSFTPKSSVRVTVTSTPFIPAATASGNYYIGVLLNFTDASTANNNTEGWDSSPITVTCPPGGTPSLVSPANGATCLGTSVLLDWGSVSGTDSYQVQIGTSCGSGTTYSTTASSYTVSSLAPATTYYWRTRSRSSCGVWGSWSSCRSFTTAPGTPGLPSLTSPANGATCQGTSTTFSWSAAANAASYELQVGSSCGSGGIFAVSSTSTTVSGLNPGATYYWRVRGKNSCGTYGSWTACRSLTIAPAPPATPVLSSPPSGAGCQPTSLTLAWNAVSGAASYEVQIGNTCGTGPVTTRTTTSYPVSGLTPGATYCWRVRAANSCGSFGSWSGCFCFTVASGPLPAPALTAPANGSTCQATTVLLDWNAVAGSTDYTVQIGTACGAGPEYPVGSASSQFTPPALNPGTTYYWRVKTKNSCDEFGPYSPCYSFTTGPAPLGPPTLLTPSNGAANQPLSGTLDWSTVAGADAYMVQMGTACGSGPESVVGTSSTTYAGLAEATTYYWRVKTRNTCGQYGPYSPCFEFTTTGAVPEDSLLVVSGTATRGSDFLLEVEGVATTDLSAYSVVIEFDPAVFEVNPDIVDVTGTPAEFALFVTPGATASTAQAGVIFDGCVVPAGTDVFIRFDLHVKPGAPLGPTTVWVVDASPALSRFTRCDGSTVTPVPVEGTIEILDVAFIRGDCDGNGEVNISDPFANLQYQFQGGLLDCLDAADFDDNGEINISDPFNNLQFQFAGGPPPPAPFPGCGPDPTTDALGCDCSPFCMTCPAAPVMVAAADPGAADVSASLGMPVTWEDGTIHVPVVLDTDRPLWGFEYTVSMGPGVRYAGIEGPDFDFLSGKATGDRVRVGTVVRFDLEDDLSPGRHQVAELIFATDRAGDGTPDVSLQGGIFAQAGGGSGNIRIGTATGTYPAGITTWAMPNPFTGSTRIHFAMAEAGPVTVVVHDASGRKVRTLAEGFESAGEHALSWDGADEDGKPVATGIYFYSVITPFERTTRKLVLLR